MNFRTIALLLIVAAMAVLAALNWTTLATPSVISLGLTSFEAPLGLLMLGLTVLLGVFFIAYVLSLQGSVLLETRRHAKEMQVQRELADKAEASRFTELRAFLENQHLQSHAALIARMDALELHLAQRAQESDNTTAAYVGQLEHQLRGNPRVDSRIDPI
ncbi:LapA family protein [Acidovorax sp. SUPP3334]|uniref:LapA family protein n=1 Tax=Acidovorax sp. SUPP3334 TaxID=2920881 RepID=UPI0023DE67BC|nr:LapA family protein [Acidovorax sp. SUPP3334]GKT26464.1 Signal transduction histidine kinase [Acidovorax sp. SUPP3334]